MQDYVSKVMEFFRQLDKQGTGGITWDMFKASFEDIKVKAYFQSLDLDVSQAHDFFEMLDTDGSNVVGIDEFVEGCMRLKGGARSVDVNMVLLNIRKLHNQVRSLQKKTHQQFELIAKVERNVCGPGRRQTSNV